MQTVEQSTLPGYREWDYSQQGRLVKTSRRLAIEVASTVLRAAFSTNSFEWSAKRALRGSASKTLLAALLVGSPLSGATWNSSAMRRYRSKSRQAILALHISVRGSSLLPTVTASTYSSNQGGAAGRVGQVRYSLEAMAKRGTLLPTLCQRDEKGPGPAHTRAGADLPQALGGHLNPTWCLWFMAFPAGWLDGIEEQHYARSATRARPRKPKSPAT